MVQNVINTLVPTSCLRLPATSVLSTEPIQLMRVNPVTMWAYCGARSRTFTWYPINRLTFVQSSFSYSSILKYLYIISMIIRVYKFYSICISHLQLFEHITVFVQNICSNCHEYFTEFVKNIVIRVYVYSVVVKTESCLILPNH